jgi:hypothetical protein
MKEERELVRNIRIEELTVLTGRLAASSTQQTSQLYPIDLKVGNGAVRNNLASEFYTRRIVGIHIQTSTHRQCYPFPHTWLQTITSFAQTLKQSDKKHIATMSIGHTHTVLVDNDSNVYTFGLNDSGQLGHNHRKDMNVSDAQAQIPLRVSAITNTVATAEMMWLKNNAKGPER